MTDPRPFKDIGDWRPDELLAELIERGAVFFSFTDRNVVAKSLEFLGHPHQSRAGQPFFPIISSEREPQSPGEKAFSTQNLVPHTDYPAQTRPPELVILLCQKPAMSGGTSLLADGKEVFESLARLDPAAAKVLMRPNHVYHRYGTTFHDVPPFELTESKRLRARMRFDEFAYVCFDALPAFDLLLKQVEALTRQEQLREGEGYIVQNTRWLHGRQALSGDRAFHRLTLNAAEKYADALGSFSVSSATLSLVFPPPGMSAPLNGEEDG